MKAYLLSNVKYICVALLFLITLYKFEMRSPIELLFYFLLCNGVIELCLYYSKLMQQGGDNASEDLPY